jgi:hypothetical protein
MSRSLLLREKLQFHEIETCEIRVRALDASSPKLLSLMLASPTENKVYATDLNDALIFSRWRPFTRALGLKNYGVEYQDARQLKYADEFFDLVFSISVIERIPGRGI